MGKSFLAIAMIFCVLSINAQQVPQNNNTNSNNVLFNNTYQGNSESTEEEEVLDSVTIQNDLQIKSTKKAATRSIEKERSYKLESAPVRATEESTSAEPSSASTAVTANSAVSTYKFQQASSEFVSSREMATQQRVQRSPSPIQQSEMDEAVGYFETNAPNSFEHHYFKYVSGNYDVSLISHLREAEKMRPNNADVHVQLASYNMIKRNKDSAEIYVKSLMSSGRLEKSVLYYGVDLLESVPKNGVLITHGFDDTFAAWKKQTMDGVRKDVTLVSLDFLQSAHYRKLLEEDGFKLPVGTMINVDYLRDFCRLNALKSLSISMTTPKEYFKPIQSKLYVTGLVFEYHENDFNNFERNDELWNSGLSKHLILNASDEKGKQLSANYLPMILQLRKVYGQTEEKEKLKDVDDAADKVGLQCKKYEQVQKLKKSY